MSLSPKNWKQTKWAQAQSWYWAQKYSPQLNRNSLLKGKYLAGGKVGKKLFFDWQKLFMSGGMFPSFMKLVSWHFPPNMVSRHLHLAKLNVRAGCQLLGNAPTHFWPAALFPLETVLKVTFLQVYSFSIVRLLNRTPGCLPLLRCVVDKRFGCLKN